MIPFISQRAGGQDLATHVLNAHDNERIEIAELRGAVAGDLHGAFAEWEVQAQALTRCKQYLCSLSVSPDELQGRLSREQYLDYIERAEQRLGLSGQPRAVVFHVKEDKLGRPREHCHVIWSRIDMDKEKAVNLSFSKDKMMTVTREFARDHGLKLPDGYYRHETEYRRNRQLSSFDCIKEKETGISHEERMAVVTEAWQRSDSGRAFVNALEEKGYILAIGRDGKKPVLVDLYGYPTRLTRLIDDPAAKVKDVRAKLGPDYAPDKLPSVEEAQQVAARHRQAIEEFEKARSESEQVIALQEKQSQRRSVLEQRFARLKQEQHQERLALAKEQKAERRKLQADYLAQRRRIRRGRSEMRPKGLAAFLGRVTGIALITKAVQRHRDRKRYDAYCATRAELKQRQEAARQRQAREQTLKAANLKREQRSLARLEKRERETLEQRHRRTIRQQINARSDHMPSMAKQIDQDELQAVKEKASKRHISPLARELAESARKLKHDRVIKLGKEFARASEDERGEGETGGGSDGAPKPVSEQKIARKEEQKEKRVRRSRRRRSEEERERDREENRESRPRRRRDRDLDRGR